MTRKIVTITSCSECPHSVDMNQGRYQCKKTNLKEFWIDYHSDLIQHFVVLIPDWCPLEYDNGARGLVTEYQKEIDEFFAGKTHFDSSKERGHIWIANHIGFDTLTVEPPLGGQYEIAVRMLLDISGWDYLGRSKDNPEDTHSGYIAGSNRLLGRNTGGH